ncbi:MAG: serine/threonine-protein phosphatase, partial [Oscillospiraceae bacterium]|nr:serine/threonine-protein phosphatase [Oscillospiraceae bacterium]
GTTMVALYFASRYVYVCNLGDSRAYRLRGNEFMQISEDHVEKIERYDQNGKLRKAPLTQHLGIDPEELMIEPYIAKGEIVRGDYYLLCSDGLTDMLTNLEIYSIIKSYQRIDECVDALIKAALEKGGKDNVTVILVKIV